MEKISTIEESRESNLNNLKVTGEQPIDSNLSFRDFAVEFANRHLSGKNIEGAVKPGEIGEILEKLEGNQDLFALMQKVRQMVSQKGQQPGRSEGRLDNHYDGDIVDAIIKDLNAVNITPLQRIQILYLTVFCNFNATMIWKPSQDGHIANHHVYLEHLPKINGYVEFIWEALDMLGKKWIDKYKLDQIIIGMDGFLETVLKDPELGCRVVNKFKKFSTFDQSKNFWRNGELFYFVMELVNALDCIYGFDEGRLFMVDDGDRYFENLLNRIASCYNFNNDEDSKKVLAPWKDKNKNELLNCYRSLPSSAKPSPSFATKLKYALLNIKVFFQCFAYIIRLLFGIEKARTESIFNYVHLPMNNTQSDFITKTKIQKKTYAYILSKAISTMMENLFFKVYEEIKKNGQKKAISLVRIDNEPDKTNNENEMMNKNIESTADVEIKRQNQENINSQNDKQNLDNFPSVNVENKNDGAFLDKNEIIYFSLIDILRNIKIDDNEFRKNDVLKIYYFVKSENSGDNYEVNYKRSWDWQGIIKFHDRFPTYSYSSDDSEGGIVTEDVKILINCGVDQNNDLDINDPKNANMASLKKAGYIQLDFEKVPIQDSGACCQIKHNGVVVGHAWKEENKVIRDIDKNKQLLDKLSSRFAQSQTENTSTAQNKDILDLLKSNPQDPSLASMIKKDFSMESNQRQKQIENNVDENLEQNKVDVETKRQNQAENKNDSVFLGEVEYESTNFKTNENAENKVDVETKQQSQIENKNDDVFLSENESIHFNLIDVLRNIKIDDNKFHKNNALKIYFFVKSENSDDHYEFNDKVELPFDFKKACTYAQALVMEYKSDYKGNGIVTKGVKMLINYGVDPDHDLDIKDSKNENMDLLKKAGYIQLDFEKDPVQNSGAYCQIKHNGTVVGHAWKERNKVISDIDKNRQFINKLFGKSEQFQTENQNGDGVNELKAELFTKLMIAALLKDKFGENPLVARMFNQNLVPRQEDDNSNRSLE